LLAGEGEALTRKAVEPTLAGEPAALRLCLERIVGPYRGTRGRIHDAANPQRRRFGGAKGVTADPMEAGKIRTSRWSRESDTPS
jgi:hypothetical protein